MDPDKVSNSESTTFPRPPKSEGKQEPQVQLKTNPSKTPLKDKFKSNFTKEALDREEENDGGPEEMVQE